MKKLLVSLIFVLAGLLSGCGLYMTEGQYNRGLSLTPATSYEWARVKQDKLALEKVQALPAYTASASGLYTVSVAREIDLTPATAGFKGYIKNDSRNRTYNIKVWGPENKSWYVPPGAIVEDYLIPGNYLAKFYYGSYKESVWSFKVDAQLKYFEGRRDAHWYLVAQW